MLPDDDAAVVQITARGWTQVHNVDPGYDLTVAFLQAGANSYSINIQNTSWETFYQYWYVWATPQGLDYNDTVETVVWGTFGTGEGDDQITLNVAPGDINVEGIPVWVVAGPGDDIITSNNGINHPLNAYGGSGDDAIIGTDSPVVGDLLYGDAVDYFYLYPISSTFVPVPTTVVAGDDVIVAQDGDDTIFGGGGNDNLDGGLGNDSIVAGVGDSVLTGSYDDDTLSAEGGDNTLLGGDGADSLTGGTGSDYLYGGPRGDGDLDVLAGGGGADVFMLSYTEGTADGADFWTRFFDGNLNTITGNAVENALANIFTQLAGEVAAGFVAAAFGSIGQDIAVDFLSWLENLTPSDRPEAEDVIVVTDFDPSQDLLVLPVAAGVDFEETVGYYTADAAGETNWGITFTAQGRTYAELTLSADYLTSIGLDPDTDENGTDAPTITAILDTIVGNAVTIDPDANFSNLSNVAASLSGGGFKPPTDAGLPAGTAVTMFGAIGGLVAVGDPDGGTTFVAGTIYADVLTANPVIKDPTTIPDDTANVSATAATIYGLGGDDIIYGTNASDILAGGAGDDAIYTFRGDTLDGETVTTGAGNDTVYAGNSLGDMTGGGGSDTFAILTGTNSPATQVVIDLEAGIAAERAPPADTAAPVGAAPPFAGVPNSYTLAGFENAVGGTVNDWLRAAAGSVIEGAAGADYLDVSAGGATLSYATSAAAVSVLLYADGAQSAGGDAQGDVIAGAAAGLLGSAGNDTLGAAVAAGSFAFTGGGGADTFAILGPAPSGSPTYNITDFGGGDRIDLSRIGVSWSDVAIAGDEVTVSVPGTAATFTIALDGFTGALSQGDFILATAVAGRATAGGGGSAFTGGSGADTLLGRSGADVLFGNAGADDLFGAAGDDVLDGGRGSDRLVDRLGGDRLDGGDGRDTLEGGAGADLLAAGAGNDRAEGGSGADRIGGGAGRDSVAGGSGADAAWGGAGDDRLIGNVGADRLWGGTGRDSLRADAGRDHLAGGADRDLLRGGDAADTLRGGAGRDTLEGGAGADVLDGDAGPDHLAGGSGADLFRLRFGESDGDRLLDFDAAEGDRIVVVSGRTLGVTAHGDGVFTLTDGIRFETVVAADATAADFLL